MFVGLQEGEALRLPHEQVVVRQDRISGLAAVIAIHDTRLGPAAGGCRRWSYVNTDAAIMDALRLSEGMTYKNALAGIPFGGGKSVIMAPPGSPAPTNDQLRVFAGWLNELNGSYITAEDVGMGVAQMQELAKHTQYASGLGFAGLGGDPSPKTAYGVYLGICSAVRWQLGRSRLAGLHVSVQGLGAVGMALCEHLHNAGARLTVADINPDRVQKAVTEFGASCVSVDEITRVQADVFAPCALGGVIDEAVAATIPVQIIAGAANNQLRDAACADVLAQRGVLYAPDFVINAAGVISVAQECLMHTDYFAHCDTHNLQRWVEVRIQGIEQRLERIFKMASDANGVANTDLAARQLALEVLNDKSGYKESPDLKTAV